MDGWKPETLREEVSFPGAPDRGDGDTGGGGNRAAVPALGPVSAPALAPVSAPASAPVPAPAPAQAPAAVSPVWPTQAGDYVRPPSAVADGLQAAALKASLPVPDLLIRGFLAGAFLSFATSLAAAVWAQGLPRIAGAVVFPVGFVMLVLLGLELATGNFALLPKALAAGRIGLPALLRNWWWVYVGNLAGSLLYAVLFASSLTGLGANDGGPLAEQIRTAAVSKTLGYAALGGAGWAVALFKAVLANWMVTVGVMMAFISRSAAGKVVAMWPPIMTFFGLGYEHAIVNMFLVPAAMLLGAPISLADWWWWNQIPVTLGNILGGALFTGLALYFTYRPPQEEAARA